MIRRLGEGLSRLPGTEVYLAPRDSGAQSGVLSFRVQDRDCEELGELLGRRGDRPAGRPSLRPAGPPDGGNTGVRDPEGQRVCLYTPGGDRPRAGHHQRNC